MPRIRLQLALRPVDTRRLMIAETAAVEKETLSTKKRLATIVITDPNDFELQSVFSYFCFYYFLF